MQVITKAHARADPEMAVVDLTGKTDDANVAAVLESLVAAVALSTGDDAEDDEAVEEEDEDEEDEEAIVVQLAASKVALLVGLHDFGDIGEAVLEYVYQDREELLARDAKTLDLRIVSKDDELQELVNKTGAVLAPQLEEILSWTRDRQRRPVKQQAVAVLLESVDGLVAQARGKRKLQAEEAHEVKRLLSERICLSYGCRNEDLALKTYEQQTGSSVRLSNQEFYVLEFPSLDIATESDGVDFGAIEDSIKRRVMVKGTHRRRRRRHGQRDQDREEQEQQRLSAFGDGRVEQEYETDGGTLLDPPPQPFFTICGMIDGVADTLEIADDDEWQLVPILLEVKNRMRAFRVPPPLYDYIQMAVYLKMLGLTAGDLIQCLHADRAQIHVTRVSLSEYPLLCRVATTSTSTAHHSAADGLWATVLLPRLYAMVQTIATLRSNDLLRLAFLNGSEGERRAILRRECDFL